MFPHHLLTLHPLHPSPAEISQLTNLLKGWPFTSSHIDSRIANYRERRVSLPTLLGTRMQTHLPPGMYMQHLLELRKTGYILPHTDALSFGSLIAVANMWSDTVIRFRKGTQKKDVVVREGWMYIQRYDHHASLEYKASVIVRERAEILIDVIVMNYGMIGHMRYRR